MTLDQQIRARVDAFVKDLEGLIRQAALQAVAEALGATPSSAARGLASAKARTAPAAVGRTVAKAPKVEAKSSSAGRRGRRSPKEIEALANAIADYVAQNPGQRAEQIKQALKIDTTDWLTPVKKLLDEGRLATKGEKRATTYVAKRG